MVKEIFNAITTEQSKELVEIAEIDLVNMTTLGQQIDGYRTAQGTWISNNLEISNVITDLNPKNTEAYEINNLFNRQYVFEYNVGIGIFKNTLNYNKVNLKNLYKDIKIYKSISINNLNNEFF